MQKCRSWQRLTLPALYYYCILDNICSNLPESIPLLFCLNEPPKHSVLSFCRISHVVKLKRKLVLLSQRSGRVAMNTESAGWNAIVSPGFWLFCKMSTMYVALRLSQIFSTRNSCHPVGDNPVHCMAHSSSLTLYPLDASINPQVVTTKDASRHCIMFSGELTHSLSSITGLNEVKPSRNSG